MNRPRKQDLINQIVNYLNPRHDGEKEILNFRRSLMRLSLRNLEMMLSCLRHLYVDLG